MQRPARNRSHLVVYSPPVSRPINADAERRLPGEPRTGADGRCTGHKGASYRRRWTSYGWHWERHARRGARYGGQGLPYRWRWATYGRRWPSQCSLHAARSSHLSTACCPLHETATDWRPSFHFCARNPDNLTRNQSRRRDCSTKCGRACTPVTIASAQCGLMSVGYVDSFCFTASAIPPTWAEATSQCSCPTWQTRAKSARPPEPGTRRLAVPVPASAGA